MAGRLPVSLPSFPDCRLLPAAEGYHGSLFIKQFEIMIVRPQNNPVGKIKHVIEIYFEFIESFPPVESQQQDDQVGGAGALKEGIPSFEIAGNQPDSVGDVDCAGRQAEAKGEVIVAEVGDLVLLRLWKFGRAPAESVLHENQRIFSPAFFPDGLDVPGTDIHAHGIVFGPIGELAGFLDPDIGCVDRH